MIAQLILHVCLAADPAVCQAVPVPTDFDGVMECTVDGQRAAAEWVAEHPRWQLDSFSCGPLRSDI